MFIRFVGGCNDGLDQHVPDDQDDLYVAVLGTDIRDHYLKTRWEGGGPQHGYDALFVHDKIPLEGYEDAIKLALKKETKVSFGPRAT